jgi:Zn-dependent protease
MKQARTPPTKTMPIIFQRQEPHEYGVRYGPLQPKIKIRFSNREIRHLAIAVLLVTGIGLSWSMLGGFQSSFLDNYMVLATVTAILVASYFMHEMAHKTAAQRRGLWAEFRIVFTGALFTLISIFLPFKIISPGTVMVSGFVDKENEGRISIAGPLTNIILSTIFLLSTFAFPLPLFVFGAMVNSWIALFNLLPFGMLDGFKVFLWKKVVWGSAFTASLILTIVSFVL